MGWDWGPPLFERAFEASDTKWTAVAAALVETPHMFRVGIGFPLRTRIETRLAL